MFHSAGELPCFRSAADIHGLAGFESPCNANFNGNTRRVYVNNYHRGGGWMLIYSSGIGNAATDTVSSSRIILLADDSDTFDTAIIADLANVTNGADQVTITSEEEFTNVTSSEHLQITSIVGAESDAIMTIVRARTSLNIDLTDNANRWTGSVDRTLATCTPPSNTDWTTGTSNCFHSCGVGANLHIVNASSAWTTGTDDHMQLWIRREP